MTEYNPNNSAIISDLGSQVTEICINIADCNQGNDLLLKPCDQLEASKQCGQCCPLPYQEGATFDFQTSFVDRFNSDPNNPANGWGTFVKAKLCDETGTVISEDHTMFASEFVVTPDYQTIRIDTTKTPDCWSLKICAYNANTELEEELCSEPFAKIAGKNTKVICLESKQENDCKGTFYGATTKEWIGSSNFEYSNSICVAGALNKEEGTTTRTVFGGKVKNSTFQQNYTLRLAKPIPCFLFQYIQSVIFPGEVYLNGEHFQTDDTVTFENVHTKGLYLGSWSLYQECKTNNC